MASLDDLLLPQRMDLVLRHQLPDDLLEHINRVGRCIWRHAKPTDDVNRAFLRQLR